MSTRKSYAEQLKHPNWQRKRLEVLQDAGFHCELCEAADKTLHVHHKRYVKGREIWEYERSELQCLCEDCHAEHHELHGLLEEVLASAEHFDPYRIALGLVTGYLEACYAVDHALSQRVRARVGSLFDVGVIAATFATASRAVVVDAIQLELGDREPDPVVAGMLARWAAQPPIEFPNDEEAPPE